MNQEKDKGHGLLLAVDSRSFSTFLTPLTRSTQTPSHCRNPSLFALSLIRLQGVGKKISGNTASATRCLSATRQKADDPLFRTTFCLEQIPARRPLGTFQNSPNRVFIGVPFFLLDVCCQPATFTPLPYQVVEVVNTTISCDSVQMELPFIFVTFLWNLTE